MADLNKIIDELSTLTVVEAADLSKQLEEKWGVTAAAPVAAAAPGAAAPAGEAGPAATASPAAAASWSKFFAQMSRDRVAVFLSPAAIAVGCVLVAVGFHGHMLHLCSTTASTCFRFAHKAAGARPLLPSSLVLVPDCALHAPP